MEDDHKLVATVNDLIAANKESAKNFYAAAEQMENRAIKLLLKAYSQERTRFAHELQAVLPQADEAATHAGSSLNFFARGWLDLKAAMVVRRQRRHRILLEDLHELESNSVESYANAAARSLPPPVQEVVQRQAEHVRTVDNRLQMLAEQLDRQVALRLFNKSEDIDGAIRRLEQIGLSRSDLAIVPIENITVYRDDKEAQPRATREAIFTGGLLGLLAGGALGLLYGSFHRLYFPELNGLIATTPTGVMWEMSMHGALIGLFFSLIFSTLIASSAAETDTFLYEDSFQNGDTLVAVITDADRITSAERAIGLQHEYEIEPVAA
jgi:uncharacterized protein (TIGR02284 family)